jgi:drug/metabolite transporter (DMT)-like permease
VLELRRHGAGAAAVSGPVGLTPRVALLLVVPPLLWAGNALTGRLLAGTMTPLLLNALRWVAALVILLPLAWAVLATRERRAEILARWRPLALLGGLGVGAYNALQYLALQTSTPINVTLIASSVPVWMMLIGRVFYGEQPRPAQWLGAALSTAGVLVVLTRGDPAALASLRLVPGDLWILLAALSWAFYSWQLARPPASLAGARRPAWSWAEALLVQVLFGLVWAGGSAVLEAAAGAVPNPAVPPMGGVTAALAIVFLGLGPSVIAYRCWGMGVAAVGPAVAGFFSNLTPLFAALFSAVLLGDPPRLHHAVAFAGIVAGIWLSSRR